MNGIIRSGIVVILGGGVALWSMSQSEAEFERVTTHYGLDAQQVAFTKSCESSLDLFDKTFKDGARKTVGCGCMAAELGKSAGGSAAVDYEMMGDALYSVIKFSETSSRKTTDVAGMFGHMTNTQNISYTDALLASGALSEAMGVCNDAKLPKTLNAVSKGDGGKTYQPTITDAPAGDKGCEGLSASSIETLQKIADREGKSLEQVCNNVIS